ncbi:MAG: O-antigen ligase domain-containing protein, partial [Chloroflexota bacterium]
MAVISREAGVFPSGHSRLSLIVIAVLAGVVTGMAVTVAGPLLVSAFILAIAFGVLVLRSPVAAIALLVGLATVLPFGVIPMGLGPITLGLVEVSLILVLTLGIALWMMDRTTALPVGGELAFWFLFAGFLVFAFLLGIQHGYTPDTMHNFAKFGLGVLMFPATLYFVRDVASANRIVALISAGTGVAAVIGLALYAGGASFTERALSRLIPYGYPSGRIVRFIEDDPSRAMRAVGTSIDPNAFGGLLMIGFVLAVGQLVIRRRALSVPVALGIAAATGLAMLLTYSRGAWVGAAAGVIVVL